MTETTYTVTSGFGKRRREVTLEVGRLYVIDPLNPKAKRNRGRVGELLAFVPTGDGKDTKAAVRCLDNRRVVLVPLGDLAETEPTPASGE